MRRESDVSTMAAPAPVQAIDPDKMNEFLGRVLQDFGGLFGAVLANIGDRLGLYKALVLHGPVNSAELAAHTGTHERYIREWLINQAAGGYITYHSETGKYSIAPEQSVALTDESSPFFVGGGFQVLNAAVKAEQRIAECFRTGEGMFWGEHDHSLFEGTERFFKPGYAAHLVHEWIPALNGMRDRLEAGAKVADVGCGHGASTIIMAQAFPRSTFHGFDFHERSIARAREAAQHAGVERNVRFDAAVSTGIPGSEYDLVTFFDCLHDMPDPVGAARTARQIMKSDGAALIVEPMAGNRIEENFNPVGRIYSGASIFVCMPNAIAGGGKALGAVATEDALRETVLAGGLTRFQRVAETPFNRIFEARP